LDRLITYNIVNRTNEFYSKYGLYIGGGGVSQKKRDVGKQFNPELVNGLRRMDDVLSANQGNMNAAYLKDYKTLKSQMVTNYPVLSKGLVEIG
jgi:hypothetical protein